MNNYKNKQQLMKEQKMKAQEGTVEWFREMTKEIEPELRYLKVREELFQLRERNKSIDRVFNQIRETQLMDTIVFVCTRIFPELEKDM